MAVYIFKGLILFENVFNENILHVKYFTFENILYRNKQSKNNSKKTNYLLPKKKKEKKDITWKH